MDPNSEARKENFLLEPLFENVHVKKASEAITEKLKTQHYKHKIFQIHGK